MFHKSKVHDTEHDCSPTNHAKNSDPFTCWVFVEKVGGIHEIYIKLQGNQIKKNNTRERERERETREEKSGGLSPGGEEQMTSECESGGRQVTSAQGYWGSGILQVQVGWAAKDLGWVCLNVRAFLEFRVPGFQTRITSNNFEYCGLESELEFEFFGLGFFGLGLGFFKYGFWVSDNMPSPNGQGSKYNLIFI